MKNKFDISNLIGFPHFKEFIEKKDKFILDEDNNVIAATLLEWGQYLEETPASKRRIGRDEVNDSLISTVFLGLNHSFDGRLDIFETMVFKKENDSGCYCERYSSWKKAEEGHQRAIEWVKNGCKEVDENDD